MNCCSRVIGQILRRSGRRCSTMSKFKTNILIVGLGNHTMPDTRHSIGMSVVNRLATHFGVQWMKDRDTQSLTATYPLNEHTQMVLIKSKKFMNLNGKTVGRAVKKYDSELSHVFLIHDELDKRVGNFGIKQTGSARGHNGVRSVHDVLQTQEVSRLLIGIDRPADRDDVADYVLAKFTHEERKVVSKVTDEALCMLAKQIEKQTEVDSELITSQIRDSAVEPES